MPNAADPSPSNNEVKCTECSVKLDSTWALNKHVSVEHPLVPTVSCRRCGFMVWDRTQLASHWRQFHKRAAAMCPICSVCELDQDKLDVHLREVHAGKQKLFCRLCCEMVMGLADLKKHVLEAHGDDTITCDECEEPVLFKTKQGLEKHKEELHMSEMERLCRCDICGLDSPSLTAKRWHRSYAHPTVFPHRCELCGLRFRWARNLRRHLVGKHWDSSNVRSLVVGRSYVCGCCHVTFGTQEAVARHYKIEHEVPQCQECERYFFSHGSLRRHQNRLSTHLVLRCLPTLPEYVSLNG